MTLTNWLINFPDKIAIFMLIFIRMSSLFVITPIFGRREMPSYMKIGFAFFCSIIIAPVLSNTQLEYTSLLELGALAMKEMLVGIIMGYVSFLVFSALYVAGQIMDMQIGFGMVNVIDPMMGGQVPMMGNFFYILTALFFLMIDGHHVLFKALFESYQIIPLGGFAFSATLLTNIVNVMAVTFLIGVQISIPILAALLLTEVGLGILSRSVPQMNVFVIGMPLKIALGLLTLYYMIPVFFRVMQALFDKMYSYLYLIMISMV